MHLLAAILLILTGTSLFVVGLAGAGAETKRVFPHWTGMAVPGFIAGAGVLLVVVGALLF